LLKDASVLCWGRNTEGQLGDGTFVDRPTPTPVMGLKEPVVALALGAYSTCVKTAGGAMLCWGHNAFGQLGDGTVIDRAVPGAVTGLARGVWQIAAGFSHACALTALGQVSCWGDNRTGQLGSGVTTDSLPAATARLATGAEKISAGSRHTCAQLAGGTAACWGLNWPGQLGDGGYHSRWQPQPVAGLDEGVMDIAAGMQATCAVVGDAVRCWGRNDYGQLGDGTFEDRRTPVDVINLPGEAVAVANAYTFTCAQLRDGAVACWGRNPSWELPGSIPPSQPDVVISEDAASITGGILFACARMTDGRIQCWGTNGEGQLGRAWPSPFGQVDYVLGIAHAVAVDAGGSHTCAALTDGGVQCWGDNQFGQLGSGSLRPAYVPTSVLGLAGTVVAITAGGDHSCAILQDGLAQCWGRNEHAQLGDGTFIDRTTPVTVTAVAEPLVAISAGDTHTCALTKRGEVQCWGDNAVGQLGVDPGWTPGQINLTIGRRQYLPSIGK
jgi:alpha-tubulin suppressor-like RCC1 family protein